MQLKVLQWNVWYKENIERVLDILKSQSVDVICLQELTRGYIEQSHENTWEYIAYELGFAYQAQEIPVITSDAEWSQANAILSRFPIRKGKKVWLHEPLDPYDPGEQYRGYQEVHIDVGGIPVTIATTHLSFNIDPDNDQELQRLLDIVDTKSERFILTGDLNATPDSRIVSELAKHLQHAGPPYRQNTWTTKPYDFAGVEVSTLDWRYDYIFTTKDITSVDARIVKTDVSDHLPIIITLQVSK